MRREKNQRFMDRTRGENERAIDMLMIRQEKWCEVKLLGDDKQKSEAWFSRMPSIHRFITFRA